MCRFYSLLGISVAVLVLGFSDAVLAETKNVASTPVAQPAQTDEILLYAEPKAEKLIKKLPPSVQLIPIFQQGQWLKVGDPTDGQTGWVNTQQYQQARDAYFRPNIQTIYIQTTADQKGKPTLNVVAYKNGVPVSQEEALKLYNQLRDQQARQLESMQRFSRSMQRRMDRDFLNLENVYGPYWMNSPWMQPVVILPVAKKPAETQSKAPSQQNEAPKSEKK